MASSILVSAVKTRHEITSWMRLAGKLRLHKIIPVKSNRLTEKAQDKRMGIETKDEKEYVDTYRRNADPAYLSWAIDKILTWKNTWIPMETFNIHGEHDRMFPMKNISPTHVIKGGTHIMILNRTAEISRCIEGILLA